MISSIVMREKSYTWQREMIVGSTLCFSVVARMKMAYDGGSSRVLSRALKAAEESMCTSSMINTEYLPICGGIYTCVIRSWMSSTLLLEAASNSCMFIERCSLKALHDSHSLHASASDDGFRQLMAFARIRAQVVFPTPRGPLNK